MNDVFESMAAEARREQMRRDRAIYIKTVFGPLTEEERRALDFGQPRMASPAPNPVTIDEYEQLMADQLDAKPYHFWLGQNGQVVEWSQPENPDEWTVDEAAPGGDYSASWQFTVHGGWHTAPSIIMWHHANHRSGVAR